MNRNLKVGYNTRDNGTKRLTRPLKFFPKLVLQGNWLEEAGFNIGDETEVKVNPGKIEIVNEMQQALRYESAYQDFINHVDNIFYEGFARNLAKDQPKQFYLELNQFLNTYTL